MNDPSASDDSTTPSLSLADAGIEVPPGRDVAILAGGCFWCTEAVFENMKGVDEVVSGYIGGTVENPSYEAVCSGQTGHAEAVKIIFDPDVVSFADLLQVFFGTHDPTTLNRQGADSGTQYRSAIFPVSPAQQALAEQYIDQLNREGRFRSKIVTSIEALSRFYAAESYHQGYFRLNPGQGYCRAVVGPKVEKFKQNFGQQFMKS
ncbi:MAG: peptide-methionine (S)-S-oxide reductase MsrA [Planctomycetota bacterium]